MRRALRSGFARLSAALVLAAVLLSPAAAPAAAKYASLVMDVETGRVLHSVNADTRNYPASLTKMMTLYMVFEALDSGRLDLDDRLKVSARAARQPASRLGLRRGQTISVDDAILALVTKSANDVATVIAEALSGSERKFALAMTAKARKLGMTRTIFRNASGLPHRGQLSTARDMGTLARALIHDYPQYYRVFATKTFRYGGLRHRNHNKLLGTYAGADGIKTGYIRASGFNLVASARRGDHRVIGVLFGGRSPKSRNRLMTRLLDKGFTRLDPTLVADSKKPGKPKAKTRRAPKNTAKAKSGSRTNDWGIQVGAYHKRAPAYEIARKAVAKAPKLLEDGVIKVVPLHKRNRKPVYRARILGITKRQAYRACAFLEERNMSCMELRMKKPLRVADARR